MRWRRVRRRERKKKWWRRRERKMRWNEKAIKIKQEEQVVEKEGIFEMKCSISFASYHDFII